MSAPAKAVLLDLGNVVFAIDFRRVFRFWAEAAAVPVERFYDRWATDAAYAAHEVGELSFEAYSAHLGECFDIDLPIETWRAGWNQIWLGPFAAVAALLDDVAAHYHLCAFSNTNETHTRQFTKAYAEALSPFSKLYLSNEIGLRKPDAAAYRHVCSDMGFEPEAVIFLDDLDLNVAGAHAVGMDARHVQTEAEVAATLRSLLPAG